MEHSGDEEDPTTVEPDEEEGEEEELLAAIAHVTPHCGPPPSDAVRVRETSGGAPGALAVHTERLMLRAVSERVARAAIARDHDMMERLVGAAVPVEWPGDVIAILPRYADALARDVGQFGWGPWLAIDAATNAVVGDLGFKGPPSEKRTVEIGFETISTVRNRGVATEAARSLVAWAMSHDDVDAVLAECERGNAASTRVLEKVGLRRRGTRGSVVTWQMNRPGVRL